MVSYEPVASVVCGGTCSFSCDALAWRYSVLRLLAVSVSDCDSPCDKYRTVFLTLANDDSGNWKNPHNPERKKTHVLFVDRYALHTYMKGCIPFTCKLKLIYYVLS